ncbi:hypothetical protein H2200_001038 [Cladophialophora chaetospira]|uniref:Uncharacterized protein n=1 Tax=Cladophialophora chaetospira TaxID=386627 RepID=A0AA39CNP1_9EURO|nr:hypothetical protein H2200_001038 [Cladophialophora chaetospira]
MTGDEAFSLQINTSVEPVRNHGQYDICKKRAGSTQKTQDSIKLRRKDDGSHPALKQHLILFGAFRQPQHGVNTLQDEPNTIQHGGSDAGYGRIQNQLRIHLQDLAKLKAAANSFAALNHGINEAQLEKSRRLAKRALPLQNQLDKQNTAYIPHSLNEQRRRLPSRLSRTFAVD